LGVVAFLQWRRRPGEASAWLAASFGVLSLVVVVAELLPDGSDDPIVEWGRKAMFAVLALFPFCLYRFMTSLVRPVPWVRVTATALSAAVVLGALALPEVPGDGEPRPAWFLVYLAALLTQWVLLSGLVAVRLWRAGRGQPTVARRRMQTMSLGAAGLAMALVVASAPSSETPGAEVLIGLLALAAAPLMLVGFAPPYFLRLAWRRHEESALAEARLSLMRATSAPEVARTLLPHARVLVGARAALLEDADGAIVATDGLDIEEAHAAIGWSAGGESTPPDAASNGSLVRIPMGSGRLTVLAGPFTPFFGREEIATLEGLAALADLALARSELLASQRRLAEIVESSEDAIVSTTLDGAITSWNLGAEKLFGYAAEEVIGKPTSILIPPACADELAELRGKVRAGEAIEAYETRRQTKDGGMIDVSLTISPVRDADGNVAGASTIARDVSERRSAESQRDMLLVLTRVLAESNSLDEGGSRLLEELCGRMDWDLGALWLVDQAGEALELASRWRDPGLPQPRSGAAPTATRFAAGEGLPGEVWRRGEAAWLEDVANSEGFLRSEVVAGEDVRGAAALPVWSGSQVLGVVELFSRQPKEPDPRLAELLRSVGGQVGNFVERARAALVLQEAKQEAERANRAKSEFLSRMSHELRTPLNAIIGFGQLLEMNGLDETEREYVELILKGGHHLLGLINEILDISRIESATVSVSIEPVDADSVVAARSS